MAEGFLLSFSRYFIRAKLPLILVFTNQLFTIYHRINFDNNYIVVINISGSSEIHYY